MIRLSARCVAVCFLAGGLWVAHPGVLPALTPADPAIVSLDSSGNQTAGTTAASFSRGGFSGDNRYVVFDSEAANLVANDTNGVRDVFVRDLQTGVTTRVSVASDGTEGNGASLHPSISADGRYIVFQSRAKNLAANLANPEFYNIFLHDRQTGQTVAITTAQKVSAPVSATPDSVNPVISADGTVIAFQSSASNLLNGGGLGQVDTNGKDDIYVYLVASASLEIVSRSDPFASSDGDSAEPSLSADGSFVAFASAATNLVSGDSNHVRDVFVRDVANFSSPNDTGAVRVSSHNGGTQSVGDCFHAVLSGDARHVLFESFDLNLDDAVGGVSIKAGQMALYVHDFLFNGTTIKVSGNSAAPDPFGAISMDGGSIVFGTPDPATPGGTGGDVSLWRRINGATTGFTSVTSVLSTTPAGTLGGGLSNFGFVGADGTAAGFYSLANDLVAGDANGAGDVFVAPAGTVGFSAPVYSVPRSGLVATLAVVRTAELGDALTLTYTTADGTATAGSGDYTFASGTVAFAAGETVKTIAVPIPAQAAPKGDRNFFVRLGIASGRGSLNGSAEAQVSILEDRGPDADHLGHGIYVSGASADGFTLTLTNPGADASFAGKFSIVVQAFAGAVRISPDEITGSVPFASIPAGGSIQVNIANAYKNGATINLPLKPALYYYGLVYENTPLDGFVLQNAIFLQFVNPTGPSNGVPAPGPGVNAPGFTPGVFIKELDIVGPDTANEGDPVVFTAAGTMSDGSPFTGNPTWTASALSIDATGQLTTAPLDADTVVTVTAESSIGGATQTATKTITIHHAQAAAAVVTLVADVPMAFAAGRVPGRFVITRTGGDVSQPLTVNFQLKGDAVRGEDYPLVPLLKTIEAGKMSVKVKIKPVDHGIGNGGGTRVVKMVIRPGDGYTFNAPLKGKVKIFYDR